jgi:serine/threonine protein kinase
MKGSEAFPHRSEEVPPVHASVDDFLDNQELHTLLKRLPMQLLATHLDRIGEMEDDEAIAYIRGVHEKRREVMEESVVSDPSIRDYFGRHAKDIWKALDTEVFEDVHNMLGSGQTARVMRYEVNDLREDFSMPFAIKYLVTPTEKTLSASGEHDLLLEVERIEKIEQAEAEHAEEVPHLRVPHPYFHHQDGRIQCYGMELIDGADLLQVTEGTISEGMRRALQESLRGIDRDALYREVDVFFDAMHTVCLHGDIKLANIMVSQDGHFYIIDFGQSILANDIDDKSRESFDNLKDDEKKHTKTLLAHFLNTLEG